MHLDDGVERSLFQVGDHDAIHGDADFFEHRLHEVVCHGSRRHDSLQCERNCGSLGGSNPDREKAFSLLLPQKHDRLIGWKFDTNARQVHFDHRLGVTVSPAPSSDNPSGAAMVEGSLPIIAASAFTSASSAAKSSTARMYERFRYRSSKSSP